MKYKIYAGLGGGFGGANYIGTFEGESADAQDYAYEEACQMFESQLGLGIESEEDIRNEAIKAINRDDYDNPEEYEAAILEIEEEILSELRDQWIEHYIEDYDEEDDDDEEYPLWDDSENF